MPKEYIYPEQSTTGLRFQEPDAPQDMRAVKVIWNKMGYVQVATVKRADGSHRADLPATVDGMVDDGQHIELSRQDVNTLIRTLRRARQQAYGRDE